MRIKKYNNLFKIVKYKYFTKENNLYVNANTKPQNFTKNRFF